ARPSMGAGGVCCQRACQARRHASRRPWACANDATPSSARPPMTPADLSHGHNLSTSPMIVRMDPALNPFAPGAGTPPPELAGRDELREVVRVACERLRLRRPTKSILMVGLR